MGSAAGCHSICSHATEDGEVLSSKSESSHNEGDGAGEDDNAEEDKGGIETSSDGQVESDGEEGQVHPHTQDTLTGISQVFGGHEDTDTELVPREKIQSIWQKWHPKSPKEDSALKESSKLSSLGRSHQLMRHSVMRPGKKCGCWTHILMLGIMKKLPIASQAGQ